MSCINIIIIKLVWDDEEVFFRIINERIHILNQAEGITPIDFWNDLIVKKINGVEIKKFLHVNIIPRPRDIIFFFNTAKNVAVSRGHSIIEENDILKAHSEYSNWVFKSIIVENGITMGQMHDFLYNLLGESVIINKERLVDLMVQSGISNDDETIDYFIDRLVALSVLGREIRNNEFEFVYDFENGVLAGERTRGLFRWMTKRCSPGLVTVKEGLVK